MDSREQFEQIFSKPPFEFNLGRYSHGDRWPDNYRNYEVQCAWEGWQASREALVVELPDGWFDDRHGEYLATHTQIEQALSAAGIKWK